MSDEDLRQALLGTWRLISFQEDVNGALVEMYGDNPQGYLVYTADGHVFVQFGARQRPELFGPPATVVRLDSGLTPRSARGLALLKATEANTELGFSAYCGTFEVRNGQVLHHIEFHLAPAMDGRTETRSVVLEGDRLILKTPTGSPRAWRRVRAAEPVATRP
jgi:hypothetical protein